MNKSVIGLERTRTTAEQQIFHRNRGAKHLLYQEYLRSGEGKSFQCWLPFSPTHKCPEKSLKVTILAEDECMGEEEDKGVQEAAEGAEVHFLKTTVPYLQP